MAAPHLNVKRNRGVPQAAILSPLLFNTIMSSILTCQDVYVYIYADDIAFFAADSDIYVLQQKLQIYMNMLEIWLQTISMSINVSKSAVLVFTLAASISVSIAYKQEPIRQVDPLKYLGIIYSEKLNWSPHKEYIAAMAQRALGLLRRMSNRKYGVRRNPMIMLYKMYMRPILEFGCLLFSGGPAYIKLSRWFSWREKHCACVWDSLGLQLIMLFIRKRACQH